MQHSNVLKTRDVAATSNSQKCSNTLVSPVAALVPTAGRLLQQAWQSPCVCERPVMQVWNIVNRLLNPTGGKLNKGSKYTVNVQSVLITSSYISAQEYHNLWATIELIKINWLSNQTVTISLLYCLLCILHNHLINRRLCFVLLRRIRLRLHMSNLSSHCSIAWCFSL